MTKKNMKNSSHIIEQVAKKTKKVESFISKGEAPPVVQVKKEDGRSNIDIEKIPVLDLDFAEMLLSNTPDKQRHLRSNLVDRYAADMLAGRWRITGDPIRLNKELELIDGQHRLAASIKAEKPLKDVILEVLHDDKAFDSIDVGAQRNLRDMLKLSGSAIPASTVIAGILFEAADFKLSARISMAERLQVVNNFQWLDELTAVNKHKPTAGMLAAYVRAMRINKPAADAFFTSVFSNHPMVNGQYCKMANLLATWIINAKHTVRPGKSAEGWKRETAARCISAWNAWRKGKELVKIQYKPGDAFPKML